MTDRQNLVNRTARRLLSTAPGGYGVFCNSAIHRALTSEGWTPTSDAAYRRILSDVQKAAREIYTASLPKHWS